jgi:excisionase family DNA binding protein
MEFGNEELLTVKEAAAYLGITTQYAYQLRHNGKGPKCEKIEMPSAGAGPRLRLVYQKSDLDEWNAARLEAKKPKAKAPPKPRASRKKAIAEAA